MTSLQEIKIGIVSTSDRASAGVYKDEGLPELRAWFSGAIKNPIRFVGRLVPDEYQEIREVLVELVDREVCDFVVTTGGTGPAPRDVTPDATLAIAERVLPGFGEQMRAISLNFVPTAILSRQVGIVRKKCLVFNLPGQPKSIKETLEGLRDPSGVVHVPGIFAAVPYCIDLIGGPFIETHESVVKAFRPKPKR